MTKIQKIFFKLPIFFLLYFQVKFWWKIQNRTKSQPQKSAPVSLWDMAPGTAIEKITSFSLKLLSGQKKTACFWPLSGLYFLMCSNISGSEYCEAILMLLVKLYKMLFFGPFLAPIPKQYLAMTPHSIPYFCGLNIETCYKFYQDQPTLIHALAQKLSV